MRYQFAILKVEGNTTVAYLNSLENTGLAVMGLGSPVKSINVNPHRCVPNVEHMKIKFENGFGLSILSGQEGLGIYTGEGLYEVAILDKNDNLVDVFDNGDTVYGYQTVAETKELIIRVSNL